ncbi:MAG: ATP-binding cassette domain-containing protein [Candidatus Cloacimonetes bacterium]|nr:ATP-binding cassette domain-containing protein [Candidatus Cloacimonadota bacterium]
MVAVAQFTLTNNYYISILNLTLLWAAFGVSWNIFSGSTGLISFGHALFFGYGAYLIVYLQVYWSVPPLWSLPFITLGGALLGLIIGALLIRLEGIYFALATMALPLIALYTISWLGLQELAVRRVSDSSLRFMQFDNPSDYVWFSVVILITVIYIHNWITRSALGIRLSSIHQDSLAAATSGINVKRDAIIALTISAALSATVGSLYATFIRIVTPESTFGLLVSAQALVVAIVGGVGAVFGPVLGALILIPLSEWIEAVVGGQLFGIQGVLYGSAIIIAMLWMPQGILPPTTGILYFINRNSRANLFNKLRKNNKRYTELYANLLRPNIVTGSGAKIGFSESEQGINIIDNLECSPEITIKNVKQRDGILEVNQLCKNFGNVKALQDISFRVNRGEILGIIGSNGAGKTTLFNMLNGIIKQDSGNITIFGIDTGKKSIHAIARMGVGRTYQVARPFEKMTVTENIWVGAMSLYSEGQVAHSELKFRVDNIQKLLELTSVCHEAVGGLPTVKIRAVELGRALVANPDVLLIDEGLAGLSAEDAFEMVRLLKKVAAFGITTIIIEHTMNALLELVTRLIVMDNGKIIAEGVPREVVARPEVIEAYLGKGWTEYASD